MILRDLYYAREIWVVREQELRKRFLFYSFFTNLQQRRDVSAILYTNVLRESSTFRDNPHKCLYYSYKLPHVDTTLLHHLFTVQKPRRWHCMNNYYNHYGRVGNTWHTFKTNWVSTRVKFKNSRSDRIIIIIIIINRHKRAHMEHIMLIKRHVFTTTCFRV